MSAKIESVACRKDLDVRLGFTHHLDLSLRLFSTWTIGEGEHKVCTLNLSSEIMIVAFFFTLAETT